MNAEKMRGERVELGPFCRRLSGDAQLSEQAQQQHAHAIEQAQRTECHHEIGNRL